MAQRSSSIELCCDAVEETLLLAMVVIVEREVFYGRWKEDLEKSTKVPMDDSESFDIVRVYMTTTGSVSRAGTVHRLVLRPGFA